MAIGTFEIIFSIAGWALALLLAALLLLQQRKVALSLQNAEHGAAAARDALNVELATLRRLLEAKQLEASELGSALSDLNAHVAAARTTNSALLNEIHRRLLDRLNLMRGIFPLLAPARQEFETEIQATTLHDRKARFNEHLARILECEAYLDATIPLREEDLEALEAFRKKIERGRFDEAFEESSFEKLGQLLEQLDKEKHRALLEGINRPGHLEFNKVLKFREALAKTRAEKRLEADIKAQKARSVMDD